MRKAFKEKDHPSVFFSFFFLFLSSFFYLWLIDDENFPRSSPRARCPRSYIRRVSFRSPPLSLKKDLNKSFPLSFSYTLETISRSAQRFWNNLLSSRRSSFEKTTRKKGVAEGRGGSTFFLPICSSMETEQCCSIIFVETRFPAIGRGSRLR